MALATFMRRTTDFDDEADFGAGEVCDVIADDELAAKGEAELRAGRDSTAFYGAS